MLVVQVKLHLHCVLPLKANRCIRNRFSCDTHMPYKYPTLLHLNVIATSKEAIAQFNSLTQVASYLHILTFHTLLSNVYTPFDTFPADFEHLVHI